jgi:hypothetical protein
MPLVEIDAARLDKIAAEIDRMAGALPPLAMEHEAATGLLRNDAAMVAFILDRYFQMMEGQGEG